MTTPDRLPLDLESSTPPTGRISIEASAGTGKTYSLTQLVVLHVIHHDLRPDQLLLVTYTRAATAELRHKTREMCQRALTALETGDRDTLKWLGAVIDDSALLERAKLNLGAFLSHYDEAVISTIHGFCQRILRQSGLAGGASSNFSVVESTDEIVDHIVSDGLVLFLASRPDAFVTDPADSRARAEVKTNDVASVARRIKSAVKTVLGNTGAVLLPETNSRPLAAPASDEGETDRDRVAGFIADVVRDLVKKVRSWCTERGLVTHDDLIRLVEQLVASEQNGVYTPEATTLATTIASQYRLIMVDEFQDTDSAQWRIFESIHVHGGTNHSLVTVGDPKQAIYRFRGADVSVYVDAESGADYRFSLSRNWRSTKPLLEAIEWLYTRNDADAAERYSFDPDGMIRFSPVSSNKQGIVAVPDRRDVERGSGLSDSPFEIRWVKRDPNLGEVDQANRSDDVLNLFLEDTADCIVQMLSSGRIPDDKVETENDGEKTLRAVTPRDIAVLVNSHSNADAVVRALREVNVPAVQVKTGSVFVSEAATEWRIFLSALAHPQQSRRVRARAMSVFGTFDEASLASASEDEVGLVQATCSDDAELLQTRGITALYLRYRTSPEFLGRVLGGQSGERLLTDLDHIAELLAGHPALSRRTVAAEALAVLEHLIENSDDDDLQKRRIDTDEEAVTVMTMHSSKGLQFPVVILPTLHAVRPNTSNVDPYMFTLTRAGRPRRLIDVASRFNWKKPGMTPGSEWSLRQTDPDLASITTAKSRKDLHDEEEKKSLDRLLYVALTRAEYKVITYWSEVHGNREQSWGRLLSWNAPTPGKKGETAVHDVHLESTMSHHDAAPGGVIATRRISSDPDRARPGKWSGRTSAGENGHLAPDHARFTDRDPRSVAVDGYSRWSYSTITRIMKGDGRKIDMGGSLDGPLKGGNDEHDLSTPDSSLADQTIASEDAVAVGAMPLASTHGGAALGTLIHQVLDEIDPSADDADAVIADLVGRKVAAWDRSPRAHRIATDITSGLILALDSPLGEPFGGSTLRQLGRRHRLSEMRFDHLLPQDRAFTFGDIGELLAVEPGLPAEIASFAVVLKDRRWATTRVAGSMNGSIDAVFRVANDGETRFFVADYKSDMLHAPSDTNPLDAYTSSRIGAKMPEKGYIVQALVYAVALHRFLRWRLGDTYDFDRHFGGVSYLFVRGMVGTRGKDGQPHGVWHWQPPRALVESLDRLFSTNALSGGAN